MQQEPEMRVIQAVYEKWSFKGLIINFSQSNIY